MGQRGLFFLNKTGFNMHWNSNWDSTFAYTRYLKYTIFLENFFSLFFFDYISKLNFFFFFSKLNRIFKLNTIATGQTSVASLNIQSSVKSTVYYLGKIWFLKFQNWVVITLNFFNPINIRKLKKTRLKKKLIKRKLKLLKKVTKLFCFNKFIF